MKWIAFILIFILLPSVVFSECVEFKTVEHENGIEVVCVGEPVKQNLQLVNTPTVVHRTQYIENSKNDESSSRKFIAKGIELSGLVVIAKQDGAQFILDIKCDVYTDSYESFVITIVGMDREGKEVSYSDIEIRGLVDIGRSSVITSSAKMDAQKYFDSRTWEAKNIKTNVGTLNFVANRTETFNEFINKSSQTAYEPSTTNSITVSDVIVMKKNVRFHHTNHQKNLSCYECHVQSKWLISGFGKSYAHGKGCKNCHEERKGPTSCIGCHDQK